MLFRSASADEGFSWSFAENANEQSGGPDGSAMNSFVASRRGKLAIRLQKVSPINALLSDMYTADRANGGVTWGQLVFTHRDVVRGDLIIGSQGAYTKFPNVNAQRVGGNMDWEFDIGIINPTLGPGQPAVEAAGS